MRALPSSTRGFHRFSEVRKRTESLCAPLSIEDFVPQPMVEASPPKWHLAHTSWFFEAFLLRNHAPGYREFHDRFEELFNSYYQTLGKPFDRSRRGLITRPTVSEVFSYRRHVDQAMRAFLEAGQESTDCL